MTNTTPGSVTGTKVVLLHGGPPEWDGYVTGILKSASGTLERWDHTADAACMYVQTDEFRDVSIEHLKRNGPVTEIKPAEVWIFAGYKEEWNA
jgi:hypothetical protein